MALIAIYHLPQSLRIVAVNSTLSSLPVLHPKPVGHLHPSLQCTRCVHNSPVSSCQTQHCSQPWRPQGRGSGRAMSFWGGADGKLSLLSLKTKCCGGFHHPAGSFFGSQNGTRNTHGRTKFNYSCATSQPHI